MDSGNYLLLSLAVKFAVVDNAVVRLVIPERKVFFGWYGNFIQTLCRC
jgi:hypothetical protein